ncbi:MAG: DNA polymerase III subunit beta [Gemmatimonadota bacterium]|jgi:DNA polymerase-3 subunit beta|nr:DNA polymerase III subunit beta [Gemmatimonadota bacterium]
MKVSITREKLQEGLSAVAGSVPTRTTLPILTNILLETTANGLRLSGTDMDTSVSIIVPAEIEMGGAIAAPARKLQEIARELPTAPISLSAQGDAITISGGRSRFRLNGLSREEFPEYQVVSFEENWKATGAELNELISHVTFAVSTEETRPILNGVLWELSPTEMRMVATNGHRLARMTIPRTGQGAEGQLIVPPKALALVQKLFKPDQEVQIARSDNHIGFQSGGVRIFTRLIEGTYPKYDQVIPKDNDKILIVDRAALNGAIRRMAIVASDQTHRIRLSAGGPMMKFSVQTPDLGEGSEELPVEYSGDPIEIGFNANYLLELLRYIPTDEVKMTLKAPERAVTLEPLGNEDAPDFLCLVMPLRLLD